MLNWATNMPGASRVGQQSLPSSYGRNLIQQQQKNLGNGRGKIFKSQSKLSGVFQAAVPEQMPYPFQKSQSAHQLTSPRAQSEQAVYFSQDREGSSPSLAHRSPAPQYLSAASISSKTDLDDDAVNRLGSLIAEI
jgi:hypothetical protein